MNPIFTNLVGGSNVDFVERERKSERVHVLVSERLPK